jgi:hypothetical protein
MEKKQATAVDNTLSEADLIKIGKKVLKTYPAQRHLWINAQLQILFSEEGSEGFVRVEK